VEPGDLVYTLAGPHGNTIAHFAWTPKQPGAEIVHSVVPFIAVALAGFALLAALVPGTPCPHCHRPMHPSMALDLDHADDRSGYRGLAHASCNRRAGANKRNAARANTTLAPVKSRKW